MTDPAKGSSGNQNRIPLIGLIIGLALLIIFWNIRIGDMPVKAGHALAVSLMTATFWVCGVMPVAFASLIAVVLFTVLQIDTPANAFSGYIAPAIWLIVFALIIAKGVEKSGLAKRIMSVLMSIMPLNFGGMVALFIALCFISPFFIPSATASVALCMALAVGFLDALGIEKSPKNKVSAGLTCFIAILTLVMGRVPLTGALPNFICVGLVKQLTGVEISWIQWLGNMWIIAPIPLIATWFYITRLYKPDVPLSKEAIKAQVEKTRTEIGSMKPVEIKALIFVCLAIFLWATDGKILPAIGTNQIGMICGCLFLMPYIGVLNLQDFKGLAWDAFAFAGGTYSMGVVLTTTGFAAWAGSLIASYQFLQHGSFFTIFVFLMLFTFFLHFLLETLGLVTLVTPIIVQSGLLPPSAVAMLIPYYDTFYIFPFMGAPIILSLGFNTTGWGDTVRYGCFISAVLILQGILFALIYWPFVMF